MSDFDFLKEFGRNLDRERPHEPDDKDWEKLAASLNVQERKKRRRRLVLLWAFPVAASVMMAVLGDMLWKTSLHADKMQTEITRLQTEIDTQSKVALVDTLTKTVTVIRYDTIYRTVVVSSSTIDRSDIFSYNRSSQEYYQTSRKPENQLPGRKQNRETQTDKSDSNSFGETNEFVEHAGNDSSVLRQKISIPLSVEGGGHQVDSSFTHQTQQGSVSNISMPDRAAGESVVEETNLLPLPTMAVMAPKSQQKRRLPDAFDMAISIPAPAVPRASLIRRLQPHQFKVGLTGGILFPRTEHATPRNNYTLGINGQVGFGAHLRLFSGFERGWTNFKIRGAILDDFHIPPPPPAPSPNDILSYVEAKHPLWDFSLGLRYVFTPEKRLRPFVSAAWLAEHTQEQTLKYEFMNNITEEESYTLVPYNNARFTLSGLQLGGGVEWAFSRRLTLGLEGIYQRHYDTSVLLLAERWGIKLGMTHTF